MVDETVQFLKDKLGVQPLVGIVLGTGLNALVDQMEVVAQMPYTTIPNFPSSTVEFHKGQLLAGRIKGVAVLVMQGRFHYYEGYSMQQITFPVRVMKNLGVRYLLLSNASGGMNPGYKKGDLVITEDHINMLPDNPLRGTGHTFGNQFVDMSRPYDPGLIEKLERLYAAHNIPVKKGVYVSVMGPNLETRAEYRWLRNSGADMVGMSTVPEVIVAAQEGLKCASVSVITDECDPDNLQPVNIAEIIEVAGRADQKLAVLFADLIAGLI